MSDQPSDGKDYGEDESEAANRQNARAEHAIEDAGGAAGFSPPGGEDTHAAKGEGPTGQPHATTRSDNVEEDVGPGVEGGMLGEGG